VPLYLALLVVGGVNGWAAEFWLRVGGRLGLLIGGAAALASWSSRSCSRWTPAGNGSSVKTDHGRRAYLHTGPRKSLR
jgi:hypothetical protein